MATDIERLDELLTGQEKRIRRAIIDYMRLLDSPAISGVVFDLLEQGLVEDALDLLDTYVARIGDTIPQVWQDVGDDAARELAAMVPSIAVAISFDVTNPRAADKIRANRLLLIRQFTESQRDSVRQALHRAMMEGGGPARNARAFRNAIGLTAYQESVVASYEQLLRRNSGQALDRALRDRRFDDRLRAAIERDRPLTERQIGLMVSRYRARMLIMRSENIARTEALRAFSQAREEATEQMIAAGGIDRRRFIRVWRSVHDKRTRDWHASMDRQERGMDEAFVDGKGYRLRWPGDPSAPAETTINCRCTTTFRIAKAA